MERQMSADWGDICTPRNRPTRPLTPTQQLQLGAAYYRLTWRYPSGVEGFAPESIDEPGRQQAYVEGLLSGEGVDVAALPDEVVLEIAKRAPDGDLPIATCIEMARKALAHVMQPTSDN